MILGRDRELARVEELVRHLDGGRPGRLAVVGEAGMGKTVLLRHARASVSRARVLAVTGVDAEQQLAFAALSQLMAPLAADLGEGEGEHAAALRAALALGPPVAADRFAAYAGLLALLSRAAARTPLLVLVDDAHWVDPPSAEALAFSAARLADDPVGLLVATRPPLPQWVGALEAPVLTLGPLHPAAATALLDAAAPGAAPDVRGRVLGLAAGNPLALAELGRALDADQRAGRQPLPGVPGDGPLAESFGRTLAALPGPTRQALLLAALAPADRPEPLAAALGTAGLDPEDLAPAVRAGVLAPGGEGFRHPVLREVVRARASPAEARAAHRILAAVLDPVADRGERAGHLAAAAIGPDEEAAEALAQAAGEAAGRTAYSTAADLLERAAALSPDPAARALRLLAAAEAAFASGRPARAATLLDQALALVTDARLRAGIAHARGLAGLLNEPLDQVMAHLVREATRARDADPATAAAMMADAVFTRTMAGQCERAAALARRARALIGPGAPAPPSVWAYLAVAHLLAGEVAPADEALHALLGSSAPVDPLAPGGHVFLVAAQALEWRGHLGRARALLDGWVERARTAGAVGFLGLAVAFRCEAAFRSGEWDRGMADGEEAMVLLREAGQLGTASFAACNLAMIEAGRGREDQVRALLADVEPAIRAGVGSLRTYKQAALGLVATSQRRAPEAVEALAPLQAYTREHGLRHPAVVPWQPDLVEALVRTRRLPEARRVLSVLAEQAMRTGDTWSRAVTARCRGLLDPDFDRHFREALALHARTEVPFDRARTQLLYGERLRRARRRAESRAHLEPALAVFERLGAAPWAAQARDELDAAGGGSGPGPAHRAELTPRELQVALAVVDGLRNQDVASRLFVSEKTVERHLSTVYAKLGVRSRAELVARLSARD